MSWRGRLLPVAVLLAGLSGCVTEHPDGMPTNQQDLPKAARINTQLGSEYAREGLLDRAEEKLKLAISEVSDYAPAYATLAYVYSQDNKPELAEKTYRQALLLSPNDPDTQNNFGVFLCGMGKGDEAQRYFRKAVSNSSYATPEAAWTNAGICPGTTQAQAEADFIRALQLNPEFPAALEQMANISFDRKQYLRARAFEQRYRKVAKPGPALMLLSARTERALGDEARAKSYEMQLLQQYPESPEANQLSSSQSP